MKTSSKAMTFDTAKKLLRSKRMQYPDTEHNRKMMAKAVSVFLANNLWSKSLATFALCKINARQHGK